MAAERSWTIARLPLASSSIRPVVRTPSTVTVAPSRVFAVAIETTVVEPVPDPDDADGFGVADDDGDGWLSDPTSARPRSHSRYPSSAPFLEARCPTMPVKVAVEPFRRTDVSRLALASAYSLSVAPSVPVIV